MKFRIENQPVFYYYILFEEGIQALLSWIVNNLILVSFPVLIPSEFLISVPWLVVMASWVFATLSFSPWWWSWYYTWVFVLICFDSNNLILCLAPNSPTPSPEPPGIPRVQHRRRAVSWCCAALREAAPWEWLGSSAAAALAWLRATFANAAARATNTTSKPNPTSPSSTLLGTSRCLPSKCLPSKWPFKLP